MERVISAEPEATPDPEAPKNITIEVKQSTESSQVSNEAGNKAEYTVDQIVEHLEECAEGGEYLDIYQILAFRSKYGGASRISYSIEILKALLAAFTQILGMIVVLIQEIEAGVAADDHLCGGMNSTQRLSFRFVAFLFCMVILVFILDQFIKFRSNGMYRIHHTNYHNMPDCLNPYFIMFGRYTNTLVMIMVLYGSFLLVYFSNVATDIVLNAVAIFFILELDDLFVVEEDYKDLIKFLKEYKHQTDYKISGCFLLFNRIIYYPVTVFVFVSLIGAAVGAFVIAYCH